MVRPPEGVNRPGAVPGALAPLFTMTEADDHEPLDPGSDGTAWATFERRVARVAAGSLATVLLTGESGSGKTRVARSIHDASDRRSGPFVTVHLAGLAPTLLEAELFGHAEGAFTGASRERSGRFQVADGGTLVLEAIETLDLALQVKLLRVVQERVVEPLGSTESVPIDVRIIATTSRDLLQLVEADEFRDDLYFRLAVVPLTVPPLRTRRADPAFPELLDEANRRVAARIGVSARPISEDAVERLRQHPWPGNFRELENALERVLVLAPDRDAVGGGEIRAEEFAFLEEATRGRAEEIAALALASGVHLEDLDAALLRLALEQERGNLSAAARALGLSRRAFDYRRKKLTGRDEEA